MKKNYFYIVAFKVPIEEDMNLCRKLGAIGIPLLIPGLTSSEAFAEQGKIKFAISAEISDANFIDMISMEEFFSIERKEDK